MLRIREGRAETLGVSARNQQSNFGGGKRVRSSREEIKRKRLKCYLSTTMYKTPSKDGPDVDRPEMVKWPHRAIVNRLCQRNFRKDQEMLKRITHKRPSKHTVSQ